MFRENIRNSITSRVFAVVALMAIVATTTPLQAVFAADTGYKSPVSTHSPSDWSSASNAYTSNNSYASNPANAEEQGYDEFNFGTITSGSTINGIEVLADAYSNDNGGDCDLGVSLSWNNGSSWTSQKTVSLGESEATKTFGGASDTWGRTWATTDFTNANFALKVKAIDPDSGCDSGDTVYVDWIRVKVHYTAPVANTAPTVTLNGDAAVSVTIGFPYSEAGATWTDAQDGSGTVSVISGSVDTGTLGTYVLGYSYTDTGGLSDSKTRTVTVIPMTDEQVCEITYSGSWEEGTCINLGVDIVCDVLALLELPLPDECIPPTPLELCEANGGAWSAELEDCFYTLTVTDIGPGVTTPATADYAEDTVVALTATPDANAHLVAFSGNCTGDECSVTMDSDKAVTATYSCDEGYAGTEEGCMTPAQICEAEGGFWNGDGCEDSLEGTCGTNFTYNSETNECDYTPPVCGEGQHLSGEGESATCVDDEIVSEEEDGGSEETTPPAETGNGGGGGGGGGTILGLFGSVGGSVGPNATAPAGNTGTGTGGAVLGESCKVLSVYLGLRGVTNNPEAVKTVQTLLNAELGLTLEVNGVYDTATREAVKAFQQKYADEVLKPWGISAPTGIVFLTTQRMINMLLCPGTSIPMPKVS